MLPLRHLLVALVLAAPAVGSAVRLAAVDPESGHNFDDTKRYIDKLSISAADKAKIFEGNARRVYPRLDRQLAARGKPGRQLRKEVA